MGHSVFLFIFTHPRSIPIVRLIITPENMIRGLAGGPRVRWRSFKMDYHLDQWHSLSLDAPLDQWTALTSYLYM
jgi:hypothetical protein